MPRPLHSCARLLSRQNKDEFNTSKKGTVFKQQFLFFRAARRAAQSLHFHIHWSRRCRDVHLASRAGIDRGCQLRKYQNFFRKLSILILLYTRMTKNIKREAFFLKSRHFVGKASSIPGEKPRKLSKFCLKTAAFDIGCRQSQGQYPVCPYCRSSSQVLAAGQKAPCRFQSPLHVYDLPPAASFSLKALLPHGTIRKSVYSISS